MFYHVMSNLEQHYTGISDVLYRVTRDTIFQPHIPLTLARNEDNVTPRVCVAKSIRDCLSGIVVSGRFKRCLAANEDAFSFETCGLEVYPILVLQFDDNPGHVKFVKPSKEQVPDVEYTHEYWILQSIKPLSRRMIWLHSRSIIWDDDNIGVCKSVEWFEKPPIWGVHPWLTGFGNNLVSSKEELAPFEYKRLRPDVNWGKLMDISQEDCASTLVKAYKVSGSWLGE